MNTRRMAGSLLTITARAGSLNDIAEAFSQKLLTGLKEQKQAHAVEQHKPVVRDVKTFDSYQPQ